MVHTPKRPLFKVGQVVRINTRWYRTGTKKGEQNQRITNVFPWPLCKSSPFGYGFINGDECNEKYIQPLTNARQAKRQARRANAVEG